MTLAVDLGLWIAYAIGVALAVTGSALSIALGAANRVRLRALADDESVPGRAVGRLLDAPLQEAVGLPLLMATGMVAATGAAVVLLMVQQPPVGTPRAALLVAGLAGALLLAPLVAMVWAARNPDGVALLLARPYAWLAPIVRPALAAFGLLCELAGVDASEWGRTIRDDELRTLVNVDEENGAIEAEEIEMIAGVMELGETKVREVMVPRIDIVSIPVDATLEQALDTIIAAGHSRIPVYRQSIDDIAGLLYAKDLLRPFRAREFSPDLAALLREAFFVPESKPVDELLQELQRRKVHMAIVVDEYGGTAGLVTIEDLLEEIVGEIQDEYDAEEPRIERRGEDETIFDAGVDIDDVNRLMGVALPTEDVDTLAGLVFDRLGHVPDVGERAAFDDAEIEVLAVSGRRIRRVSVVRRARDAAAVGDQEAEAGGAAE